MRTPRNTLRLVFSVLLCLILAVTAAGCIAASQNPQTENTGDADCQIAEDYEKAGDIANATIYYTKAAEAGNTTAMDSLGFFSELGIGCEVNETQAFAWYEKGALAGDSLCMFDLGGCYHSGTGCEPDEEQAFFWWLKSAEAGFAPAMVNAGHSY